MKRFLQLFFTWWNGATFGTLLWTRRYGELVGEDQAGNRYYRTKGGAIDPSLRVERRWVIYNGVAEASAIPPEWHGWMHHIDDVPPTQENLSAARLGETASPEPHRHAGAPIVRRARHWLRATGRKPPATTRPGCPASAVAGRHGWPSNRPFPAVFAVLTGLIRSRRYPGSALLKCPHRLAAEVERVTRSNGPMSKFLSSFALLFVIGASLVATPAGAQFGSIFGNEPPPRPPQAVPGRSSNSNNSRNSVTRKRHGPCSRRDRRRPAPQQGNIQSQPLPPPPGGVAGARRFDYAVAAARGRRSTRATSRARRASNSNNNRSSRPTPACRQTTRSRPNRRATRCRIKPGVLRRPGQDHRPHHHLRRGDRRDRAIRRAAGDAARLLHAAADRDAAYRRLHRGR